MSINSTLNEGEFLTELGRCIITWNSLELLLQLIFQYLLRADDVAAHAVWHSFRAIQPRIELMRKLANKRLSSTDAKMLSAHLDLVSEQAGERAFIAHSLAIIDQKNQKIVMSPNPLSMALELVHKNYEIDLPELKEIQADINHVYKQANSVLQYIVGTSQNISLPKINRRRPNRRHRTAQNHA